jgi:hypothetical protein
VIVSPTHLGDAAYLLVGTGLARYVGGRWAWHLAQTGTSNTDIRPDKRAAYYRDGLGRPNKDAYGLGMLVAAFTIFAWPLIVLIMAIAYVLNNEGAQDLLLPGSNEIYEKEQERYNLALSKNKRLEIEMQNRKLEEELGIGSDSLPEVVE